MLSVPKKSNLGLQTLIFFLAIRRRKSPTRSSYYNFELLRVEENPHVKLIKLAILVIYDILNVYYYHNDEIIIVINMVNDIINSEFI